ncbi:MAG: hemolysin family protein [Bacteroidota bacterium]|uniref:Hemolysins and related proteins containing CBS domains n=1 Tax=Christiangramia flava JLT2011 TaxID=1229726 RepID=A0A1L7I3L7_9FLAO|nr:hemolysin family protein [Christiangramia flava]APU67735.1 Hemolysins and related proteins containing CBS domains [Christiangramia flava JLT2011]MAM17859.1 HlyC/CorC family transporter [Christiangramia sp.]MEE2771868.1 hemolysin family protein [Bacteroidota bacterium]OSS40239.1 Hemolysin [Christiangramia flava JLT2011]
MEVDLLIIFLCLLLSAFFSGMEIAYVSSNKIFIEIEKRQNDFLAKVLKRLTKKPSKFIATMLVGNNIALVVYGFFMGDLLMAWLEGMRPLESAFLNYLVTDLSLFTQTIISTLIILLTAEFLPKVFFQIYANSMLKLFAIPAYLFYIVFSFISSFVIWISDLILKRFFKTEGDEVQLAFSKVELGNFITEQMETVEEDDEVDSEIQIFQNALEFADIKAREVMIPRTEIIAVDQNVAPKDLVQTFTETGLSKILIYNDTIDDIIGYVHSFELFKKPKTIKSILLPVVFVPETMWVKDVLNILIKKRKSIAVVIDEYGGTSGMMTVEDIVEELFGEIEDEHDSAVLTEEKLGDAHFKFSARLEVDYLNENYRVEIPEGENYETLSGFILNHTEEIPQQGELINIDHFEINILETSNTRIELVELKIKEED